MEHTAYYIGVMSGTSLDGIDVALVNFAKNSPRFLPQLVAAEMQPMPQDLRRRLHELLRSGQTDLQQLGELDHRLGLLYAQSINQFLAKHQLNAEQIQAIGCHGQTIWHAPQGSYPFTMQIGDANLIAAHTNITTVADFRRKDMAYGGQGAPLVPAFHRALFARDDRITVVLNIGGISNITQLIPEMPVIGYDTGPGNALLDSWIEKQLGKPYDHDAQWAKTGKIHTALLSELLKEPYFEHPPPKSTGRELFNLTWLDKKLQHFSTILPQDVQATLLEFTAQCNAQVLRQLGGQCELPKVLMVCGGGAKNPLLMQRLTRLLPEWHVATTSDFGLDADYVEAAAFAWLAYQRMYNLSGNLPSVTGAKRAVSLGVIYPK
ncbi:anhydro-N-acetylmuramic acid kinase [Actinobacillus seminis]|nr:anhydro-N-acetylmuramic acid kinase [Actinobacillus seminis]